MMIPATLLCLITNVLQSTNAQGKRNERGPKAVLYHRFNVIRFIFVIIKLISNKIAC